MADKSQKEREYFLARVRSLIALCTEQDCPRFSDFLTEEQAAAALPIAAKSGLKFLFWGGFTGAARTMLGVFPEWMEPDREAFPIVGATFRFPAQFSR